ncbi:MAG: hypothetical protein AAF639_37640 [Chloroflexota bacterium]
MEKRIALLNRENTDQFVDRHDELAWLKKWGTQIPKSSSDSVALVGRRRTGKTSVLAKLYEYLFYEQTRVTPIFITFETFLHRDIPITNIEYIQTFLGGYIASYMAFHQREPSLLRLASDWTLLREEVEPNADKRIQSIYQRYDRSIPGDPHNGLDGFARSVCHIPRYLAQDYELWTALIIDEFQVLTSVYNPLLDRIHSVTSSFQKAAESLWAPMLVSGSAVSLLTGKALAGGLSGRFGYHFIQPLPKQYTYDLVGYLAQQEGVSRTEEFSEMVWEITGGYPYAVESLMTSQSLARTRYPELDALKEVIQFEVTNHNGQLWQHYSSEFDKYSHELNDGDTTRKVMYWTTKYPDTRIDTKRIAKEIGEDEKAVRASLEKLKWVDIVQKAGLSSYKGTTDPMLRRYIEYHHKVEVENVSSEEALKEINSEYQTLLGRVNNFVGHMAEGYMYALLSGFDGRRVDGKTYFSHDSGWNPKVC